MKKTIKILILAIFLLPLQQAHAQEKHSDATWEETLDFIDKYKDQIVGFYDEEEIKYFQIHFASDISKSKITYTGFKYFDYYRHRELERTIPLKYLLSAEHFDDGTSGEATIRLKLVGDYKISVLKDFNSGEFEASATHYTNEINFDVRNLELEPRMVKAFQHLAYLANKKRKQVRAESGDKF